MPSGLEGEGGGSPLLRRFVCNEIVNAGKFAFVEFFDIARIIFDIWHIKHNRA